MRSVVSLEEAMDVKNAAENMTDTVEQAFRLFLLSVKRIFYNPLRYLLDSIKIQDRFLLLNFYRKNRNTPRSHRLNSIRYSVVPASSCFVPVH